MALTYVLQDEIEDFIAYWLGQPMLFGKSLWFEDRVMKVFLRCSRQYLLQANGEYEYTPSITIANVTVFTPGQGTYRKFLDFIQAQADEFGAAFVVENVLTAEHYPIYERRGFVQSTLYKPYEDGSSAFFYKLPKGR